MCPQATLVAGLGNQYSEVPNNLSAGTRIGDTATSLVGFYGATPIAQPASGGTAVTTTAASTSSPWGFTTSTQANAIVTLVNDLQAVLVSLGLISS